MVSINVETATLDRFNRRKAHLSMTADAPSVKADMFVNHLLDLYDWNHGIKGKGKK